jgi:hypothetical protein
MQIQFDDKEIEQALTENVRSWIGDEVLHVAGQLSRAADEQRNKRSHPRTISERALRGVCDFAYASTLAPKELPDPGTLDRQTDQYKAVRKDIVLTLELVTEQILRRVVAELLVVAKAKIAAECQ